MNVLGYICFLIVIENIKCDAKDYFWFLTDLHYDPSYWDEQWSCLEDVSDPGLWGDYSCDSPWSLIESAVKAARIHGNDPEFIIWSGDVMPHFKEESDSSRELLLDITKNITQLLYETFPNVPILPVLGNNDYNPKNELPADGSDLYDDLANIWGSRMDNQSIINKFKEGGFYSVKLNSNMVALVINSNLYNNGNPLYAGESDPGGQFEWMVQQLKATRENEDIVYIFQHIPPGYGEIAENDMSFYRHYNEQFLEVLEDYSDVVAAVFTGHKHLDTFKLVQIDDQSLSTIFVAPSITPFQMTGPQHNPGIRKIWMKEDNSIDDIDQYFLDLLEANSTPDPEWKLLYRFKDLYKIEEITPVSLKEVVREMEDEDSELFDRYHMMNTVNKSNPHSCDSGCKYTHLCSMKYVHVEDYENCIENIPE